MGLRATIEKFLGKSVKNTAEIVERHSDEIEHLAARVARRGAGSLDATDNKHLATFFKDFKQAQLADHIPNQRIIPNLAATLRPSFETDAQFRDFFRSMYKAVEADSAPRAAKQGVNAAQTAARFENRVVLTANERISMTGKLNDFRGNALFENFGTKTAQEFDAAFEGFEAQLRKAGGVGSLKATGRAGNYKDAPVIAEQIRAGRMVTERELDTLKKYHGNRLEAHKVEATAKPEAHQNDGATTTPNPSQAPPTDNNSLLNGGGFAGKSKYEIDSEKNFNRITSLNSIVEDLNHVKSSDRLRALDNDRLLKLETKLSNAGHFANDAPRVDTLEDLVKRLRLDRDPGGQFTADFNAVDKFYNPRAAKSQIHPDDFKTLVREPQLKLWVEANLNKSNTDLGNKLLNIADGKGDASLSEVLKEVAALRKTPEYQAAAGSLGTKRLSPQETMLAMQKGELVNDSSWNELARFMGAKKSTSPSATTTGGKILEGAGGMVKGLVTYTVGLPWKGANILDTALWRNLGSDLKLGTDKWTWITRNPSSKLLTTAASALGLTVATAGALTYYDPEHPTGGGMGRTVANLIDLDKVGAGDGKSNLQNRLAEIMRGNPGYANQMLQEYFGINDKGQLVKENENKEYEPAKIDITKTQPDGSQTTTKEAPTVDSAEARYRIAIAIRSAGTFDNPEIKNAVQQWLADQIQDFKGDSNKIGDIVSAAESEYASGKASSMRANPAVLQEIVLKGLKLNIASGSITDIDIGNAIVENQNTGSLEYYAARKFYAEQFGFKEENPIKISEALRARAAERGKTSEVAGLRELINGQTSSSAEPIDLVTAWGRLDGIPLTDPEQSAFTQSFNKNAGDGILTASEAPALKSDLTEKIDAARLSQVMEKMPAAAP